MLRISALMLGAAIALGLVIVNPPTASAQEVTLRLHTLIPPPANPYKTFLQPWADKVAKASDGRIKVQLFPSMQLGGKPPQLVDQARDGVVDIVWTLPGYTAGRFPRVEVFELPFVHTNPLSTTLAIQDFQPKYLTEEFSDYKVLLLHVHAGSLIMSKRKAIRKMSDMRGLKIRTATRAGGWFLADLGAVPIGAPLPQIPQMLSKGVISGALLPYEIAPAIKMQELVTHFSTLAGNQPRLNTSVFSFLMNKASYAKLSSRNKQAIDSLSGPNIARWAGQNWADIEIPARKVMASKKQNRFHVIPAKEVAKMKKAAAPALKRWVRQMDRKGVNGQQLLDDARALVAKYTK